MESAIKANSVRITTLHGADINKHGVALSIFVLLSAPLYLRSLGLQTILKAANTFCLKKSTMLDFLV
jgi:hypothetical protein